MPSDCNIARSPARSRPIAPAFTARELEIIARWSAAMNTRGVRTQRSADHRFLTEALHVLADTTPQTRWLIHKTAKGAVAVRLWPGIAEIMANLPDALARISSTLEAGPDTPEAGTGPAIHNN